MAREGPQGGSSQIHIPGKLINRGCGAEAGSVAPSFLHPLAGEPDGTPQGMRGTSGAFGEDLSEIACMTSPYNGASGWAWWEMRRFGPAFLKLFHSLQNFCFETGPHSYTFFTWRWGWGGCFLTPIIREYEFTVWLEGKKREVQKPMMKDTS